MCSCHKSLMYVYVYSKHFDLTIDVKTAHLTFWRLWITRLKTIRKRIDKNKHKLHELPRKKIQYLMQSTLWNSKIEGKITSIWTVANDCKCECGKKLVSVTGMIAARHSQLYSFQITAVILWLVLHGGQQSKTFHLVLRNLLEFLSFYKTIYTI